MMVAEVLTIESNRCEAILCVVGKLSLRVVVIRCYLGRNGIAVQGIGVKWVEVRPLFAEAIKPAGFRVSDYRKRIGPNRPFPIKLHQEAPSRYATPHDACPSFLFVVHNGDA
jgi:hypothetical protein